ncbi:MAG: lipid-A-disaccharide synthase [Gemmatimonadales bacterium]
MFRILISAGEPSGDLHGGSVVAALRARVPGTVIDALGGPHLADAGANVRFGMDRLTVMGLTEIVRAIPAHARMLRALEQDFRAGRYHLALPIDYPGFNLRVAEAARRNGVPVLYYIAPKHWASGWGHRLTRRLARVVDRLACIVPFEPNFFAGYGIAAEYVGHPSLDEPALDRGTARRAFGIGDDERVVALLPGSRRQEVARLWGPFRDAARLVRDRGACDRVLVAAMAGMSYPECEGLDLVEGQSRLVLAAADAAIVKSGTATVEAALALVPMVVAYRMHPVTAWIARRLLRVPWISMVNLIAGREVVPEVLQREVTGPRLAQAAGELLESDSAKARVQREGFRVVRERLGGPGAAGRVAAIAEELLTRNRSGSPLR